MKNSKNCIKHIISNGRNLNCLRRNAKTIQTVYFSAILKAFTIIIYLYKILIYLNELIIKHILNY